MGAELSRVAKEVIVTSLDSWFHRSTVQAIDEIAVQLDSSLDLCGTMGSAEATEEDTRPRRFLISVSPTFIASAVDHEKAFRHEFVKLIAHEMIHVRQLSQRRLKSCVIARGTGELESGFTWNDAVWKPPRGMPASHQYWMTPWEIEARAAEDPTFHFWVERFDKTRNWALCMHYITPA